MMKQNVEIVIVDEQEQARAALSSLLTSNGYHVVAAGSSLAARELLAQRRFDLMIAEIELSGPGATPPWELLATFAEPPALIVLTGRPSLESAIGAVNAQAAAYLVKPCEPELLLSRVEAALGRRGQHQRQLQLIHEVGRQVAVIAERLAFASAGNGAAIEPRADEPVSRVGELLVGASRRAVVFQGEPLLLTPIEHKLLRCLCEANGKLQGYTTLAEQVYGYRATEKEAAALLKSHARNLRRKLPAGYLVTVRNAGYMLVDPLRGAARGDRPAGEERFLEIGAAPVRETARAM